MTVRVCLLAYAPLGAPGSCVGPPHVSTSWKLASVPSPPRLPLPVPVPVPVAVPVAVPLAGLALAVPRRREREPPSVPSTPVSVAAAAAASASGCSSCGRVAARATYVSLSQWIAVRIRHVLVLYFNACTVLHTGQ